jgi:hypothetical protein
MKEIKVLLMGLCILVAFSQTGCGDSQDSIIRKGMDLEKAQTILKRYNAQDAFFDRALPKSSKGDYLQAVTYTVPSKGIWIEIAYDKIGGKNKIVKMSFTEIPKDIPQYKSSKAWTEIEVIDLKN